MNKFFQILSLFIFSHFMSFENLYANCWECEDNLFEILHNTKATNRVAFLFRMDSTTVRHDYHFLNHGEVLDVYQGNFESARVSIREGGSIVRRGLELKKNHVFFILSSRYGGFRNQGVVNIKDKEVISADWRFSRNISGKKDSAYIVNLWSQYIEDSKSTTNRQVEYHFVDGKTSAKGMIKNGKPHGLWKYYFKNGNVAKTYLYEEGEFLYQVEGYEMDGQLKSKLEKIGKEIHGTSYYKSGKLNSQSIKDTLDNFLLRTKYSKYHENGQLRKTYTIYGIMDSRIGYNHGQYTEYDEEGKVISKGKYYWGAKVGKWLEYNKKDKTSSKVKYTNFKTKKDGKIRFFYEDGRLRHVGVVNNKGRKDGVWKSYSKNEKSTTPYKDGLKDGIAESYDSGKKIGHTTYVNGKKDGSYKGIEVYKNKRAIGEGNYLGYLKIGAWTTKLKGQIVERAFYNEKGKLHGELIQFNNGAKLKVANYENGLLQGDYELYYRDGSIKEKGQYDKGYMVGEWVAYHKDGSEHARCIQSLPTLQSLFSEACGYFHHRDKFKLDTSNQVTGKLEPWD